MIMNWPKPDERLFKADSDWQWNACLGYMHPSLSETATQYWAGAVALSESAANGDATLDAVIVPIVFLYRQYLELSIKAIIASARILELENTKGTYPKHHNLRNLWDEAKRLVKQHYGPQSPPELDHVDPCINEFDEHDPDSFAFRYPTDKHENPTLQDIRHINLRNLCETMERLRSLLDCIASDLGSKVESLSS